MNSSSSTYLYFILGAKYHLSFQISLTEEELYMNVYRVYMYLDELPAQLWDYYWAGVCCEVEKWTSKGGKVDF